MQSNIPDKGDLSSQLSFLQDQTLMHPAGLARFPCLLTDTARYENLPWQIISCIQKVRGHGIDLRAARGQMHDLAAT
jgi:hypothetical protein